MECLLWAGHSEEIHTCKYGSAQSLFQQTAHGSHSLEVNLHNGSARSLPQVSSIMGFSVKGLLASFRLHIELCKVVAIFNKHQYK